MEIKNQTKQGKALQFGIAFLAGLTVILIAVLVITLVNNNMDNGKNPITNTEGPMKNFASETELKEYINTSMAERNSYNKYSYLETSMLGSPKAMSSIQDTASSAGSGDYSQTNIQVKGVDEPDMVKNDGKYIYMVNSNKVEIIDAYPASSMNILSEINLSTNINNIFLNEDKLILFTYGQAEFANGDSGEVACLAIGCPTPYSTQFTKVLVYNIADRKNPQLKDSFSVEGNYNDARMIGSYVYLISNQYIQQTYTEPPIYIMNGVKQSMPIRDIYYPPQQQISQFTIVSSLNIDNGKFQTKAYLTDYSSTIYVSENNIYLTYTKSMDYNELQERTIKEAIMPILSDEQKDKVNSILDSEKSNYEKLNEVNKYVRQISDELEGENKEQFDSNLMKSMQDFQLKIAKESEKTTIHKIAIDNGDIEYQKLGEVPGHILNQFSMDEFNGNFRIATTTGDIWGGNSLNHLYVLNEDMKIVGSVEDLAKGEKIYSARFMGKRAYIVTFKKVDPLFVLDLSIPESPKVLGYLKITGYSDYLHPYDENHLIGIGKEAEASDEGNFAWYQGMKVSLFDVTDVENPIETAKFNIGDRGTSSNALYDHKAVLFDKEKGILAIPVSLYERKDNSSSGSNYGTYIWEGLYVLNINSEEISLRGRIQHEIPQLTPNTETETQRKMSPYYYRNYFGEQIQRSLYIGNVIYTISNKMVKANDLETVQYINDVKIPVQEYNDYPILYDNGGLMAI